MHKQLGQSWTWRKTAVFLLIGFLLFVGCKTAEIDSPLTASPTHSEAVQVTQTAVPTKTTTPQPTHTATTTPSPTPTVTPTATAVPLTITGDPRADILHEPEPQDISYCGIVDLLDFPLDPPDALTVHYGGRGFGNFRSRYDQYHAGEDWQLVNGRSNLGVPVYAIGHGRVVYAHPNGWGTDKGVIIIRHTFADGSTVLSFYGHMEPESVTLRAGDCVVRGQHIANIGKPRTPPHLHFEIRTHMPDEPGRGYWSVDPTEAGWLAPSPFIWNQRMAAMPGTVWTRPFSAAATQYIDQVDGETFLALEAGQLIALNKRDGTLRWQQPMTNTVTSALLDADHALLYATTDTGELSALPLLPGEKNTTIMAEEPLWQVELDGVSSPTLLPLPAGGVVVLVRQGITAVSATGELLWQAELEKRPFDWLLTEDQLILTSTGQQGPIYSLTAAEHKAWPVSLSGKLLQVGEHIWLYGTEGLYRLNPAALTADLLYPLAQSRGNLVDIISLPDGGALIAHQDRDDARLIAFAADGAVQWQRSYAELGLGELRLLLHNSQPYLLQQTGSDITTQFKLYAIDITNSTLRHIFTGGTRTPLPEDNWLVSVDDDLLVLNVGGGSMVGLEP
ncbi:MAG: peptidoglycan DD-metalloendopeptidase family protein [Anaerolineae bacterium]|nr:peptidoglycan DD-metalloendopeptidase family protein [Anaerolineae bacterium]